MANLIGDDTHTLSSIGLDYSSLLTPPC